MILVLLILLCAHCTEELSTPRVYLEEDDSSSPNLLCAHCTKELITTTVYLEEDDSSTPYSIVCTDELNTQTVYLEEDGSSTPNSIVCTENAAKAAERTETINIVRSLIDYNRLVIT